MLRYSTLDKQYNEFISIIKQNKDLMIILDYLEKINLNNCYIAAGAVFQTIWNYYDDKCLSCGIKDIDIVYYDSSDLSKESEKTLEDKISNHFKNMKYKFDVHNEARMHLWKFEKQGIKVDPYKNSEDAIDRWIATVHAIGITKKGDDILLYAPYGLSDIFSKTIRPIKHDGNSKEIYDKKARTWCDRFSGLNIINW